VRYTPIPNSSDDRYLGWVSGWRFVVGGGYTALRGVGVVVSHADPGGAGGVRPHYERSSLISRRRSAPRGDVRLAALDLTVGSRAVRHSLNARDARPPARTVMAALMTNQQPPMVPLFFLGTKLTFKRPEKNGQKTSAPYLRRTKLSGRGAGLCPSRSWVSPRSSGSAWAL
jgi:hypothetical protein